MQALLSENPHRRYNPLTGEWVLVSPHRTKRPWQGKIESLPPEDRPKHDSDCYLCPANDRAAGVKNPDYDTTYVFTNDFAALLPDTPEFSSNQNSLLRAEHIRGTCRVVCFSPRHDLTLTEMSETDIEQVIQVWMDQVTALGKKYHWVQLFENKGEILGCSNPHPHGQIWATDSLPNEAQKEEMQQRQYHQKQNSVLLIDYLEEEINNKERIIVENEDWVVLVPFWAVWPFETLLLPRRHIIRITDLTDKEVTTLARILKSHLIRYDNLFETAFPYTMGWHGAPMDSADYGHWQLHAHFYPPLLRSATVRKFMVGYELLSEAQRDITPEQAARRLRELPDCHYKES